MLSNSRCRSAVQKCVEFFFFFFFGGGQMPKSGFEDFKLLKLKRHVYETKLNTSLEQWAEQIGPEMRPIGKRTKRKTDWLLQLCAI